MEMYKSFKELRKQVNEDVAGNNVGGGAIAGVGIGSKGEPGFKKKENKPSLLRRRRPLKEIRESKEDGRVTVGIPVLIRMLEIAREKLKSDDELHIFVEKIMDIKTQTLTMDDVKEVFKKYGYD